MIFKPSNASLNPFRVQVNKKGLRKNLFKDAYHHVLAASWFEFLVVVSLVYIALNLFFASLYFIGDEAILNARPGSLWDCFVFSFQTSTTIGYGHLLPATQYADILVIFDTLLGFFFAALVTGLAFARFSKPTSHVIFTNNCVIHNYDGKRTLMFRVANARDSHIADASIDASAIIAERSQEGVSMQRIRDLKLVRSKSPIFSLSWTVMHIIDEESPLADLEMSELEKLNVRIVISMTGIDDLTAQLVHATHVYRFSEIIAKKRLSDILTNNEDSSVTMDYSRFHELIDMEK